MRRTSAPSDIQVAIGPHPARPEWRVLRVSYATCPEHDARLLAALDAIFGPPQEPSAATQREGGGNALAAR